MRWRVRSAGSPGTLTLRIIKPNGSGQFTGDGTGTSVTPVTDGSVNTFVTQLPIHVGEQVGVDCCFGTDSLFHSTGNASDAYSYFGGGIGDVAELSDGEPFRSPQGTNANNELLINADVVAPPTSSASACGANGVVTATVTPDPDPATAAKAIHYRIDGGAEQAAATSGNPGTASVTVPVGQHTLEYWGEDQLGLLEANHHTESLTCKPSNAFTLGKATSKKNGTATLTLNVPGPGELAVSGNGVKSASAAGAHAAKTVTAPGAVELLIKATGKKRKKLNETGKVKVTANVTFTPTGGDPSTQSTKLKLKKT